MRWLWYLLGVVALLAFLRLAPWWMVLNVIPRPATGPTVPGPEATDLVAQIQGAVYTNADGHLRKTSLPDLTLSRVASPTPETRTVFPSIHSLSEPDSNGRVAFVENRMGEPSTHALLMAEGPGKPPRTLFTRPGDALWEHTIGEHLTLTSDGSKVAYVRDASGVQFPGAYLMEGVLEILDTRTSKPADGTVRALDDGLCWFPDGRRLVYVAAVPAKDAPAVSAGSDGFGAGFAGWDPLPVVHVLDTRSGSVRKLHVGWHPRVSTDGQKVLVEDLTGVRRLVEVRSGSSQAVSLPGAAGPVLALWPDGKVLYWGLPTAGTKLRNTRSNSPLVGPKLELTIKLGVLNTQRFQTVIPYIDPRVSATWGPVQ